MSNNIFKTINNVMGKGKEFKMPNPYVAEEKRLLAQLKELDNSGEDKSTIGVQAAYIQIQLDSTRKNKEGHNMVAWNQYQRGRKVMKGRKAGRKAKW